MNTMDQRNQANGGRQGIDLTQYVLDIPYYNERMGFQMRQEEAEVDFAARRQAVRERLDYAEMQMRETIEGDTVPGLDNQQVGPMGVAGHIIQQCVAKRRQYNDKIEAALDGIEKGKRARNDFVRRMENQREELLNRKQNLERQIDALHWWQSKNTLEAEKNSVVQELSNLERNKAAGVLVLDQAIQEDRNRVDQLLNQMEQDLMGGYNRATSHSAWKKESDRQSEDLEECRNTSGVSSGETYRKLIQSHNRKDLLPYEMAKKNREEREKVEGNSDARRFDYNAAGEMVDEFLQKGKFQQIMNGTRSLEEMRNEQIQKGKWLGQRPQRQENEMAGIRNLGVVKKVAKEHGKKIVLAERENYRTGIKVMWKASKKKLIDDYPAPRQMFFGPKTYSKTGFEEMRGDLLFYRQSNMYQVVCLVQKLRKEASLLTRTRNSKSYEIIKQILKGKEKTSLNYSIFMLENVGEKLQSEDVRPCWDACVLYEDLGKWFRDNGINSNDLLKSQNISEFTEKLALAEEKRINK